MSAFILDPTHGSKKRARNFLSGVETGSNVAYKAAKTDG